MSRIRSVKASQKNVGIEKSPIEKKLTYKLFRKGLEFVALVAQLVPVTLPGKKVGLAWLIASSGSIPVRSSILCQQLNNNNLNILYNLFSVWCSLCIFVVIN